MTMRTVTHFAPHLIDVLIIVWRMAKRTHVACLCDCVLVVGGWLAGETECVSV